MPRPYVVTIHDLSSLFFDDAEGLLHSVRAFRLRRGIRRAERHYRRLRRHAARCRQSGSGSRRPHPSDLQCARSAVPAARQPHTAQTAGPEAAARERHRILERYQIRDPFLLYAGSIRPQKNIPRLIEAFAVARAGLENHRGYTSNLRLIIIGDEISRHPDVRRAVIHSRVEHCVRFLGFIPFETLRIFHELATAFVFPSLYEGFGLPPLEAMASGTPVIASAVSSLPEVVGGAAMLVNPENVFDIARGITEVLLNAELRQDLIANGRRQAAKFSWARTAGEVLRLYEDLGNVARAVPPARSYTGRSS